MAIGAPIAVGMVTWLILVFVFSVSTIAMKGYPPLDAVIAATLMAGLGAGTMLMSSLSAQFTGRDARIVDAYALEAPHVALDLLRSFRSGDDLW